MAFEDFVDPEVGIAVAATALVTSPRARNLLRQGAVFGLAAIIRAGDAVGSAARGAAAGVQQTAADAGQVVQETTQQATTTARGRGSRSARGSAAPPADE